MSSLSNKTGAIAPNIMQNIKYFYYAEHFLIIGVLE